MVAACELHDAKDFGNMRQEFGKELAADSDAVLHCASYWLSFSVHFGHSFH